MRILVDWDETIINLTDHILQVVSSTLEIPRVEFDTISWGGIGKHPAVRARYGNVYEDPLILKSAPLHDGVVESLRSLSDKVEIYIVTAAQIGAGLFARYDSFRKYLPFLPVDSFIVCKNKLLLNADLRIDDHWDNLENPSDILIKRPWNADWWGNYITLSEWSEILLHILRKSSK